MHVEKGTRHLHSPRELTHVEFLFCERGNNPHALRARDCRKTTAQLIRIHAIPFICNRKLSYAKDERNAETFVALAGTARAGAKRE